MHLCWENFYVMFVHVGMASENEESHVVMQA
jgi:hypothetical protein